MAETTRSVRTTHTASLDAEEFAAQFVALYPRLHTVATAIIGDRDQADDIVQDAALTAVSQLHRYRPGTSLAAWLAEIVRRRALGLQRRRRTRKTYPCDPATIAAQSQGRKQRPDHVAVGRDGGLPEGQTLFDDTVYSALMRLDETARACLLLQTIERLSYAEIADVMSVPQGTAMSHVHRAKARLKRSLSELAPDVLRGSATN